jgi:hypothetical protein
MPGTYNVLDYGAQAASAAFDNTAAFQSALDAASAGGGGIVLVPPGSYSFAGSITVASNVVLAGTLPGPLEVFFPTGDYTHYRGAALLLPTATTGPAFIESSGWNSGVENLAFYYPTQVAPTAVAPAVFPPTVEGRGAGFHIRACSFVNSYIALHIGVGRAWAEDLHLGALFAGIIVDPSADFIHVSGIRIEPFWDTVIGPLPVPQALDQWVANNGYGIQGLRCDSLDLHDIGIYYRYAGIYFGDSTSVGAGEPTNCYGRGSDIDIDSVQYGIIAHSLHAGAGFLFTNLFVGPLGSLGKNAIYFQPGGQNEPEVIVQGGSIRGAWQGGQLNSSGIGTLCVRDMLGLAGHTSCPW